MITNAEAIETLRANYPDACFGQLREAVDAAIQALSADAVPVVRCKDCVYSYMDETARICKQTGCIVDDLFFLRRWRKAG